MKYLFHKRTFTVVLHKIGTPFQNSSYEAQKILKYDHTDIDNKWVFNH